MGQRTAILLKKNFGNNRSTITLIHHQGGIGKTMVAYLMQEILRQNYPLNREHEAFYNRKDLPIDVFYTFEPLNNENNNYITNKEVKTDDKNEDIWDKNVRVRYGNMTDNNNGMMLVEVTQLYDEDGKPVTYGNSLEVKVGFCLGYEETSYYHKKLNDSIEIEEHFERLVSIEEYVIKTWKDCSYSKEFVKACKTIMKLNGCKEVYNRKESKRIKDRIQHIHNCIEGLTKDLPDGTRIDVPLDLRKKEVELYK